MKVCLPLRAALIWTKSKAVAVSWTSTPCVFLSTYILHSWLSQWWLFARFAWSAGLFPLCSLPHCSQLPTIMWVAWFLNLHIENPHDKSSNFAKNRFWNSGGWREPNLLFRCRPDVDQGWHQFDYVRSHRPCHHHRHHQKNLLMDAAACYIVITTATRSLSLSEIAFLLAIQWPPMSPSISTCYYHHHLPPGVLPLYNFTLFLAPLGSPGENITDSSQILEIIS